jgi:hypothetical protein
MEPGSRLSDSQDLRLLLLHPLFLCICIACGLQLSAFGCFPHKPFVGEIDQLYSFSQKRVVFDTLQSF